MKKYNVAVVGIGLVGQEIINVLNERNFPCKEIKILARSARTENISGKDYKVVEASADEFKGVDIAIFAGTEGSKGASKLYGWEAVKRGAVVIDNGDDFRMDPRVPLVVPEVNPGALKEHKGFIANPNCSTIQMVVALGPLHKKYGIKRVVVSTYQAVSGTGRAAKQELEQQVRQFVEGVKLTAEQYPHQIFSNAIPQISTLKEEFPGYYGEEIKMIKETRKILGIPGLAVSATCVRVPVLNAHSEAVNVQLEKDASAEEVRGLLAGSPGIKVIDEPQKSLYPMALEASGRDEVFVGRIRKDPSLPNTIDMWVVSDNIRKGAALNAVQIAELMIAEGYL
jgi:aspartate-semialdehyde dehydrogenase